MNERRRLQPALVQFVIAMLIAPATVIASGDGERIPAATSPSTLNESAAAITSFKTELLNHVWSWNSKSGKSTIRFEDGGRVVHTWFVGSYEIRAPGEVEVHDDKEAAYLLTFNPSVTAYEGKMTGSSRTFTGAIVTDSAATPKRPRAASTPMVPARRAPDTPAPAERKIALHPGWKGKFQGGDMTLTDLAVLFHQHGKPSESTAGDPTIIVFENVSFLTPIEEAKRLLSITGKLPSKNPIGCPGFPRSSFAYYAFDGRFEGHFNRLYLVVDSADQVVSAQLVDESPRTRSVQAGKTNFHTYNFVNYRTKASSPLIIRHDVRRSGARVLIVESLLVSPGVTDPTRSNASGGTSSNNVRRTTTSTPEGRVLEESKWYVPEPIVDLILRCVNDR